MTAAEVVDVLGVKRASVYTYVSRGWLQAVPNPEGRGSLYDRGDVERLKLRARARSGHGPVAAEAMRWGEPIVETRISTVRDGQLVYRGRELTALLDAGWGFEQVCEWLWASGDASAPAWRLPRGAMREGVDPLLGWVEQLLELARADSGRHAARREAELARARGIIGLLGAGLPEDRLVDEALICCADHELNASAFAARVAAATGADLYACLMAALATFSGPRHGSASLRVEALVDEALARGDARRAVEERLSRGDGLPGVGHTLYPAGDPRAKWLLAAARRRGGGGRRLAVLFELVEAIEQLGHPPPNLDMGLVAVAYALALPSGAGRQLFAVGRLVGWVAHVLEQREAPGLIRPRARYVGE